MGGKHWEGRNLSSGERAVNRKRFDEDEIVETLNASSKSE
jgi:hypothetical protein